MTWQIPAGAAEVSIVPAITLAQCETRLVPNPSRPEFETGA